MTAKEQADLLVGKYLTIDIHDEDHFITRKQRAKNCALVAVDEMIIYLGNRLLDSDVSYWQKVKQEIENL